MSERRKAYRAKAKAGAKWDVADAAKTPRDVTAVRGRKYSDVQIRDMLENIEKITLAEQCALNEYKTALIYRSDEEQVRYLDLFDRAARRNALAQKAINSAYEKQPCDFRRVMYVKAMGV